jgi:uncharacterized protein YjbI with pentapeptide repeats
MSWPTVGIIAAIGLAAAVFLVAWLRWLWWRLPKREVERLRLTIRDPKARADVEDNLRKAIGQLLAPLLGGAAVLIAAGVGAMIAYLQFSRQYQASHELLISNQVSKGFEQLGSEKVLVRLGGIYALAGVMDTSEQYHQPVLEALSAFVRDRTRTETGDGPPATDIQAALTVIGRRAAIGTGVPDLANAHIPKATLNGANLSGATLTGATLNSADLSGANLSGSDLRGANLSGSDLWNGAYLVEANLSGAHLQNANLTAAYLVRANLSSADLIDAKLSSARLGNAKLSSARLLNANLSGADLSGADLSGAGLYSTNLSNANLSGANLSGAFLGGADLSGAFLGGADLTKATVSQTQLDLACGKGVKLDPGLTLKPCFH